MTEPSLAERLKRLSPEQRARFDRLMREKAAGAAPAPIPLGDRSSGLLPMSFAQRRHYFLQRLRPDSPAYNNVEAVRLRGPLNIETLRAALAATVARHEVLRTRCVPGDEPMLVIAGQAPAIDVVDLSGDGTPPHGEVFARLAEQPFDLDREAPLRVTLARLGEQDHALLFVVHHIASDAWSCRLLVREIFRVYAGAELPPLPVQYADYAAWQRAGLDTGKARAYWHERLSGMPPMLDLPLEHPRPPERSDHGAELHLHLDAGLRRRLHESARDASVTPFALLLTAFGHVLHRHCGTDDVVVATPVSGRDRVETEQLIGCFVNTLVLRLGMGHPGSRRELARQVWRRTVDDLDHQELPFEHLVSAFGPERDLSAGRLAQVMINYYPATELDEPVPGLDAEPLDVVRARAKFDLTCTVVDARDSLRVTLNYATDLLGGDLVSRLGEHFAEVLDALLTDLDAPAATLPPVPPGDPAPAPAPAARDDVPVLARFQAQAGAHPDRIAVRCRDDVISYRDLDERANRLAGYLRDRGCPTGRVALLFERSVDYVVAILGALKAGLSYVPLDPAMPSGHLAAVLAASDAGLLLTHRELPAYEGLPSEGVALEDIATELAGYSAINPDHQVDADQVMYVLFTSGSTGTPKGVVVEHRHFSAYLASVLRRMRVPEGLGFAIATTFAADLGLTNLFGALATGGTLHVLPYEWAADPAEFAAYFRRHRIDFMKLVPSHLQAVAEAGLLADVVPARFLVLAGESCPWDLVAAVRSARPGVSIWNHYGPTETTVSVLAHEVPDERGPGVAVPLGFALDHVRTHVVDRHLRPVPRGAAGELLITGASVARGYLTPDGTRFISDPFSGDAGARAYRSGDRARLRPDGSVEFLGRLDRQTKIRGYRVEPSYVEAVLRRHPGIADVAVAVRQDGDPSLVAYYVGDSGVPELLEFARSAMPPYMVPAACVALDRLPLTPNGKIDWAALPEPGPQAVRHSPPTPPRHARDARIAQIWGEVLGLDQVGIDDDFFESGGDSFTAMRLARRLGEDVRVISIFQHSTVRRLADFLGHGDTGGYLWRLPGAEPRATVTATVVAVPFGGGAPAAYAELARALPPEIPLYAVELPGHDPTRPDQPLEAFETTATGTVREIRATIDGPIVVYGHCVGAALAYDIARRLEAGGGAVVGVILGGAFPAPRLPGRLFDLWAKLFPSDRWRSDRLYRDMLRGIGGLTGALDPSEQAATLRAVRHDARESEELYSRLCQEPGRRSLRALSVVGERDRITEFHEERYREWDLLCADTELAVLPDAGHFFLKHQAGALAGIIARWLNRRLGTPATVPPAAAPPTTAPLTTAPLTTAPLQQDVTAATPLPGAVPPATSSSEPERPSRKALVANLRGFALVTFGQLVSLVGSRALAFALGIWVYQRTGSATQFSVILVTALLPGLLALPFAGAAADRWNRRLLLISAEVINVVGTGFCLAMFATGSLQVWHVCLAAALGSIATAFQQPAYLAAAAQLIPKQYLARTNGILQVVMALSQAAGPLLGGALIALIGLAGAMLTDLATALVAIATLLAVRFPDLLFRRREESMAKEIGGGLRYITRRPSLVAMVLFFLGYNLLLGFALALLPPMVLSFAGTGTLSLATVVGALGGIAGGVAMALWGGFDRRATGMVGFVLLTGLGMIAAGARPAPVFPVVGLALIMCSIALINGHWQTMIQLKVGMELQGRILAINRMTANLTEPLGYLASGLLADAVFEPAMAPGGLLSDVAGGLFGSGPGRGMAVMIVLLGGLQIALGLAGLRWRTLHHMEDVLPDALPGATATWNRDELQERADALLKASSHTGRT
ncbi:amino acid adenylation domain-containing protein [Nonomuraea sp. NPDC002799]